METIGIEETEENNNVIVIEDPQPDQQKTIESGNKILSKTKEGGGKETCNNDKISIIELDQEKSTSQKISTHTEENINAECEYMGTLKSQDEDDDAK